MSEPSEQEEQPKRPASTSPSWSSASSPRRGSAPRPRRLCPP